MTTVLPAMEGRLVLNAGKWTEEMAGFLWLTETSERGNEVPHSPAFSAQHLQFPPFHWQMTPATEKRLELFSSLRPPKAATSYPFISRSTGPKSDRFAL